MNWGTSIKKPQKFRFMLIITSKTDEMQLIFVKINLEIAFFFSSYEDLVSIFRTGCICELNVCHSLR